MLTWSKTGYLDAALNNRTHLVLKRIAKFTNRFGLTIYVCHIANIGYYNKQVCYIYMTVIRTIYLENQT